MLIPSDNRKQASDRSVTQRTYAVNRRAWQVLPPSGPYQCPGSSFEIPGDLMHKNSQPKYNEILMFVCPQEKCLTMLHCTNCSDQ